MRMDEERPSRCSVTVIGLIKERFAFMKAGMLALHIWCLLISVLLPGCTWTSKGGVRHTFILGVGLVSRAATNGVTAVDVRSVGLTVNNGITVGLTQEHNVEVDPNVASNAVVSIKVTPFSMTVKNFNPYESPTNHQTRR